MRFAVKDADGNIVRVGSCPASALDAQAREGETVAEWDGETP